jgi:CheY-like chemotaxis protein
VTNTLHRILVVEDNAADVFLMREALKQHNVNAELLVFTNGQAAMSYFATIHNQDGAPELILLDVNLPRRNGLAVLEGLRGNPFLRSVPVVVFTSSESVQDRNEAVRLHANAFVRKSVDLEEFLQIGGIIKNLLPNTAVNNGRNH